MCNKENIVSRPKKNAIWSVVGFVFAFGWAFGSARAQDNTSVSKPSKHANDASKKFKLEFGAGLGFATALGFGGAPEASLAFGAGYHGGFGTIAIQLEGGYQFYSSSSTGTLPCTPDNQGACIEPDGGKYTSEVRAHLGRASLPIVYRLSQVSKRWIPEIGVTPGVYFSSVKATSFRLDNSQFGINFGAATHLGVGYHLPVGTILAKGGYQWSPVKQEITGVSSMHSFLFAVGYRLEL